MRSFSLDLEFMDTEPTAAITAISMVEFHHDEDNSEGDGPRIDRTFYAPVHLATAVASGGTMSASTVLWWMSEEHLLARRKWMFSPMPINTALEALLEWLGHGGRTDDKHIYTRGGLDAFVLEGALKREGMRTPWEYWNVRDTRTMAKMYPSIEPPEFVGIKHFAMDDALHEAKAVWNLWRHLNRG